MQAVTRVALLLAAMFFLLPACRAAEDKPQPKADGYNGIWFTLGQKSEHGDKYSGGLGTYTADHIPIAIYAPQVKKTFFVYGGTVPGLRHIMSQTLSPLPSSRAAPSIWYAAVAAPHTKPFGNAMCRVLSL
jgi:hypothetical protein